MLQIFLFLLISTPEVLAVEMQCVAPSQPMRSARWDHYIEKMENQHAANRVKRTETDADADICLWTDVDAATCTATGSEEKFIQHDKHQRRRGTPLALGPPEDQGMCGSCWAFATVGALFDQIKFSGMPISKLSTQYLTTCLPTEQVTDNNGCCGSKTLNAGIDFISVHGIPPDTCQPYTLLNYMKKSGQQLPTCPSQQCMGQANKYGIMTYEKLNSESDIIRALDEKSFVIAGMKVTDELKRIYKCGVYTESRSSWTYRLIGITRAAGHAVEIVDYGNCSGVNFWVVKSSWGVERHERGYFRIRRGGTIYRDLGIGDNAVKIIFGTTSPASPTQAPVTQQSVDFMSCSAVEVSRPQSDEMIMSAAEFIVQNIMPQSIRCPDEESMSTGIVLRSVDSGSVQSVSGSVVDVNLTASLEGCSNTRAKLHITDASVVIYLDNTFSIVNCGSYRVSSGDIMSIMTVFVLLLSACALFLVQVVM